VVEDVKVNPSLGRRIGLSFDGFDGEQPRRPIASRARFLTAVADSSA
jgi:hypothetical protein